MFAAREMWGHRPKSEHDWTSHFGVAKTKPGYMVTIIAIASSWAVFMYDDPDRLAPMHSLSPGARARVIKSMCFTLGNLVLILFTTLTYSGRNCATVVDVLSTPQNTIRSGVLAFLAQDVAEENAIVQSPLSGSCQLNCAISMPLASQRVGSTTFTKPAWNHSCVV